jgi:hypothetical protein
MQAKCRTGRIGIFVAQGDDAVEGHGQIFGLPG